MKRATFRTLVDLIADTTIIQTTEKEMHKIYERYDIPKKAYLYGLYLPNKDKIYIRKDMTHADKVRTLFHELAHAYSSRIIEHDGIGELNENDVETLAAKWQKDLYGFKEEAK